MKQTAVEWLAKNLKDFPHIKHSQLFRDLVNQAKEMEKQQVIKAVYDGMGTNFDPNMGRAEQYYNETFKS
jgi:hypothetical protein